MTTTRPTRIQEYLRPAAWLCLVPLLVACGGEGSGGSGSSGGQDPDPFVQDAGVAFVRRDVVTDTTGALVEPDLREALTFNAGADLFYRELASPSAPERNVTGGYTGGRVYRP